MNHAMGWCVHEQTWNKLWFKCYWMDAKWEIPSLWWKCKPPFKVNYELIDAFQNLWLMSATTSSTVHNQKHTLAHPNPQFTEEAYGLMSLYTHTHTRTSGALPTSVILEVLLLKVCFQLFLSLSFLFHLLLLQLTSYSLQKKKTRPQ